MEDDKGRHNVVHLISTSERVVLLVVVVLIFIGVGLDMSDQPVYEQLKGWGLAAIGIAFLYGTVPAIIRCGSGGVKSVWAVFGASVVLLVATLAVFYTSYYWIVSTLPTGGPPPSDKILNFPPMIAALWAAGMGWYIHFQASSKNHRTTNSFNLLMQTRTSKEFLDRALTVQITYPFGEVVPSADVELFTSSTLRNLVSREREQLDAGKELDLELKDLLRRARAADALKYLLNYYEFMAVGIKAKDLDEELLYQTLCVTVTSMYRRARPCIDYVRKPGGGSQPLAFQVLGDLVCAWDTRLRDEIHAKAN